MRTASNLTQQPISRYSKSSAGAIWYGRANSTWRKAIPVRATSSSAFPTTRSERIGADGSMKQRRRKPGKPGYWTARSKKLGRRERVFDEDEAFIFLKAAIEREGSLIAFSENYGVDKTYVSHALHGRFPIAGAIIKALGFRKVYIATKKNRR